MTDAKGKPVPAQEVEPHTICGRRRFAVQVTVPALGYAVLRQGRVDPLAAKRLLGRGAVKAEKLMLENEFLRLGLDRWG